MKIISGYKDYYDYLMGVYGQDEKLVLDRREYTYIHYTPTYDDVYTFHIGEYMIDAFYHDGKFYFGDDIKQFSIKTPSYFSVYENTDNNFVVKVGALNKQCLKEQKYLGDQSPTWKEDCPILLGKKDFKKFPILKEYNINNLTDWLSKRITKKENNIKSTSDKIKIVSAGFDLKTSFRK